MSAVRFDVERARGETRGCSDLIHFNNAGASLMPVPVCDALHDYLNREELEGGYEVMEKQAAALENFYSAAARMLSCSEEEIAFVDSATRGWAMAFYAFNFQPGDRILTSSAEYGSNLVAMLHQARHRGVEIVFVPEDQHGQVDVAALQGLIDSRVKLIALTHVPSGGGLVNPAVAVGKVANSAGIPFLLDACQSLGQLPCDVNLLGCDILCGTGRKFLRGPRGTGLLYVRNTLCDKLEPPLLNHHAAILLSSDRYRVRSDARRFESWERNCAGQVALGIAIDYALSWGLGMIAERVKSLAASLRAELAGIAGVEVWDRGIEKCGIVTFSTEQLSAAETQEQLAARRINLSLVPFSANPRLCEQQHLPELVRASLHYYNTETELAVFLDELRNLLNS
ncbi:MAG: aminotransferase [Desulfuromonas sp.]|nr:MAG: aminotransferase [Desulfuromonas sp.]